MDFLFNLSEYIPYILGGTLILLSVFEGIRILIKTNKGETVHIEPIGVFNDLPDTVTGMGKIEARKEDK